VLFLIPGFVSDFIGIVLILPGPRHLVAARLKRVFARKMRIGGFGFRVFGAGAPSGGPTNGSTYDPGNHRQGPFAGRPRERDVTPKVIDIKPISSETRRRGDDEP
jgi:UPF0716 protein FxsA